MNIILENPYRLLGVLANASVKEIVANQSKIKAFLKTGKEICFDSDFSAIMPPVKRDNDSVTKAINSLTFAKDKLSASFFWFVSSNDNDELALSQLRQGDIEGAISTLRKKSTVSACLNLAVIHILKRDWTAAIYYYTYLFSSEKRCSEFISFIDDNLLDLSTKDVLEEFVGKLLHYFPDVEWLECMDKTEIVLQGETSIIGDFLTQSTVYASISRQGAILAEREINDMISAATSVNKNDAQANLSAANTLEKRSKTQLRTLRLVLSKDNPKYMVLADKVANQIIDNCIDFYNYANGDVDKAQKILKLLRYAMRTAKGDIVKERCRENLEYIMNKCDRKSSEEVENETSKIELMISSFNQHGTFTELNQTLSECYKELETIKIKIGDNDDYYINISSKIVSFALDSTIDIVNRRIRIYNEAPENNDSEELKALNLCLTEGKAIMVLLGTFKVNQQCQERYNDNNRIFTSLQNKYNVETPREATHKTASTTKPASQKSTTPKTTINSSHNSSSPTPKPNYKASHSNGSYKNTNNEEKNKSNGCLFVIFIVLIISIAFGVNRCINNTDNTKHVSNTSSVDTSIKSERSNSLNEEKLKALYDGVSETYDLGTFEEFKAKMSQDSKRRIFYKTVGEEYDLGTYDEFCSKLGVIQSTLHSRKTDSKSKTPYEFKRRQSQEEIWLEKYKNNYLENGATPYRSLYGGNARNGSSSLEIKAPTSSDVLVLVKGADGNVVKHAYIRSGHTYSFTLYAGTYQPFFIFGNSWCPEKEAPNGVKGYFLEDIGISKDYPQRIEEYQSLKYTLQRVVNGNFQAAKSNEQEAF